MIPTSIPTLQDEALYSPLRTIIQKAVDGTRTPLFVDERNQRILLGTTIASAAPAKVEVDGDLKLVSAGSGVILSNRSGTRYYRLVVEDDGALSVDPL